MVDIFLVCDCSGAHFSTSRLGFVSVLVQSVAGFGGKVVAG